MMATVYFPSLDQADVIEVEFLTLQGDVCGRKLLVDSGFTGIAIITDISPLSLPPGVQGMVGLSFLRQFFRWGAERAENGWRFFLSNG